MSSRLASLAFGLSLLVLKATSLETSLFQDANPSEELFDQSDEQRSSSTGETKTNEMVALSSGDVLNFFDPATSWEDLGSFSTDTSQNLESTYSSDGLSIDSLVQDPNLDDFSPISDGSSDIWDKSFDISDESFQVQKDPFEVVDCTTSDPPKFGKSRVKRSDDPKACANPYTNSAPSPRPRKNLLPNDQRALAELKYWTAKYSVLDFLRLTTQKDENPCCTVLSRGLLIYGSCPSTNPNDRWVVRECVINEVGYACWELRNPTPSTLITHLNSIQMILG